LVNWLAYRLSEAWYFVVFAPLNPVLVWTSITDLTPTVEFIYKSLKITLPRLFTHSSYHGKCGDCFKELIIPALSVFSKPSVVSHLNAPSHGP